MSSITEHNLALQSSANFTAKDLEINQRNEYSPEQIKFYENLRTNMRENAKKYDNKGWMISIIFGIGFCLFAGVLYFVGVFEILQESLGNFFLPVLACGFGIVLLYIVFVLPRQFQSTVQMAYEGGASLTEKPLPPIEVIEARAEKYVSQPGVPAQGGRSHKKTYILQMGDIELSILKSLHEIIEPKRLYRAYVQNNQGYWHLLSIETLE